MTRMLPREAELVLEWTGLPGEESVKRCLWAVQRTGYSATGIYKTIPFTFTEFRISKDNITQHCCGNFVLYRKRLPSYLSASLISTAYFQSQFGSIICIVLRHFNTSSLSPLPNTPLGLPRFFFLAASSSAPSPSIPNTHHLSSVHRKNMNNLFVSLTKSQLTYFSI